MPIARKTESTWLHKIDFFKIHLLPHFHQPPNYCGAVREQNQQPPIAVFGAIALPLIWLELDGHLHQDPY